MKKGWFIFPVFLTIVALLLSLMGCEDIDQPLKITDIRKFPANPDDTLFFSDSVEVTSKQVLLEDFTGHRCVNCPKAAKLLHELMELHHPRLISYTVHAGNFAIPIPGTAFSTDLRSPLSEKLYTDFGILANPIAMIDRVIYNGLRQVFTIHWALVVQQQLQEPNRLNLSLKNTYFPKYRTVVVDVSGVFQTELQGEYHLVVYIAEDGIVSPQLNNDPTIGPDTLMNFRHHNVLRDALNSAYGEPIHTGTTVPAGFQFSRRYHYPINPDWIVENCRIIAYVGKKDPVLQLVDIIQVAELGIKTE